MTQYARVVLQDCEAALEDLRAEPTGHTFRCRWVGAIALLRAVGHVLKNRDRSTDTCAANAIDDAWKRLHAPETAEPIFSDFIEAERNNVLKTYRFAAKENVTVRPGNGQLTFGGGNKSASESGETTYEHVLDDGPFEGSTPADAVALAIDWWRTYLDNIDAEASRRREASSSDALSPGT